MFSDFFQNGFKTYDFVALLENMTKEMDIQFKVKFLWTAEPNLETSRRILLLSLSGIEIPVEEMIVNGLNASVLEEEFAVPIRYLESGSCKLDLPIPLIIWLNSYPELQQLSPEVCPWLTAQGFVQGTVFEEVDGVNDSLRSRAFEEQYSGTKTREVSLGMLYSHAHGNLVTAFKGFCLSYEGSLCFESGYS
jgi:hypothetical protein